MLTEQQPRFARGLEAQAESESDREPGMEFKYKDITPNNGESNGKGNGNRDYRVVYRDEGYRSYTLNFLGGLI